MPLAVYIKCVFSVFGCAWWKMKIKLPIILHCMCVCVWVSLHGISNIQWLKLIDIMYELSFYACNNRNKSYILSKPDKNGSTEIDSGMSWNAKCVLSAVGQRTRIKTKTPTATATATILVAGSAGWKTRMAQVSCESVENWLVLTRLSAFNQINPVIHRYRPHASTKYALHIVPGRAC